MFENMMASDDVEMLRREIRRAFAVNNVRAIAAPRKGGIGTSGFDSDGLASGRFGGCQKFSGPRSEIEHTCARPNGELKQR